MAFEFLFESHKDTDFRNLLQGDILRKSEVLSAALNEAHSYYSIADDYTHFMVLTQSCDLAKHGTRKPKSRYITLAAIRPANILVDGIINKYKYEFEFPVPICSKDKHRLATELLERLLHNTEAGYFFIRKNSHPNITDDLCVYLVLSVALQIKHYDACINSKIAQLTHIFQAKVGWVTGNLYSRIGTPDIEEKEQEPDKVISTFNDEMLGNRTAWLTPGQLKRLKALTGQCQVPLRFLPQIQSAFLFSRRVDNSVARSIQRSIRSFMRS